MAERSSSKGDGWGFDSLPEYAPVSGHPDGPIKHGGIPLDGSSKTSTLATDKEVVVVDLVIEQVGGVCPVQGYGRLDGERFYFRFRHDCAELYVGPADTSEPYDDDMPDLMAPRLYAEINNVYGDPWRGWLDVESAVELLHRLIALLKPPAEWANGTGIEQLGALVDAMVEAMKDTPPVRRSRPERK